MHSSKSSSVISESSLRFDIIPEIPPAIGITFMFVPELRGTSYVLERRVVVLRGVLDVRDDVLELDERDELDELRDEL